MPRSVSTSAFFSTHIFVLQDTLKVNGLQVSPAEIEVALLDHPDQLIIDATVAGVTLKGTAGQDVKVPRAWVVLSPHGRKTGKKKVAAELEAWTRKTLSKYKWLKGGIDFVDEVRNLFLCTAMLTVLLLDSQILEWKSSEEKPR